MFNETNCTHVPTSTPSDAGVAGAGVLLAFIITAGIALILSAYIILNEFRAKAPKTPQVISRRLLNSFSDQQIIEGIGIQAVGLAKIDSIVPYHFFIIWMLSLLSTATHLATLLALVQDFKRDWVLRSLRQFFMFVNLLLNVLYGTFVLETNLKDLAPTLSVACVWMDRHGQGEEKMGNKAISLVGTIAVIAVTCILFILSTWYLHMRRERWGKVVRAVGLLILMAMAVGVAVRVLMVSQAFGSPSVKLSGPSESSWSFGQLLGMLMLILPLISALEIFRGELATPEITPTFDDQPLLNGNTQELKPLPNASYYKYQPSPLWGSSRNISRR